MGLTDGPTRSSRSVSLIQEAGGALGAKPQQERGDPTFGTDFGLSFGGSWRVLGALKGVLEGIFASLGASWACLNNKLEKDSIFAVSKTVFQSF